MVNRMIVSNVLHRPIRTAVSVLAVAIEVAMILLVVGLTTGMLQDTARRVEGIGADVMVQPASASIFIGMNSAPMPIKIADRLLQVPHVLAVAPVLIQFNASGGVNMVYGIDMQTFDRVSGGFVYHAGGPIQGPDDILVDDWYAKANHVKVGATLSLQGLNRDFHVAGIVEHGKGARLFIPLDTAQDMTGSHDKANIFFVKCTDPGYTDDVTGAIRQLLPAYKILPVKDYMSIMTSNSMPALDAFVNTMILIAACIGFLVIFLSMYTTITERTREIGILKSLGASKAYIVRAILMESSLLCVTGILTGYLGTLLGKRFISLYFPTLAVNLTGDWAARAAVLAIVGCLIGAFYPALRAASLDPIDALAYE